MSVRSGVPRLSNWVMPAPPEAQVHERQSQVAQGVDAPGEAVGAAQVHRGRHVQPVGVVLAHFGGVHPAQLRVVGIGVLDGPVDGPIEHPQVMAQALGLLGGVDAQLGIEDVVG